MTRKANTNLQKLSPFFYKMAEHLLSVSSLFKYLWGVVNSLLVQMDEVQHEL